MYNKNSNKILWITFAILLIAAVLIFTSESTKKERSFREELVSIDTSSVTSLSLFPKSKPGQEVKILNNDGIWKVSAPNNKSYTVPNSKIENIFNELLRIKPKRVAARSKSKWSEYQVDSSATRVVVNEKGSKVLDLIIGKFAFQQPRSMSTFVRLNDENDVYEVDGFLDMTFNKDVNSFRDETIIKSDKNNWTKLTFSSVPEESFELIKVDDLWAVEGINTDSSKTDKVLNSLSRLTNTNFIDGISEDQLPPSNFSLIIESTDNEPIEIYGFKTESKNIIHSSQNPENYFDGDKIGDKIFIKKESLF